MRSGRCSQHTHRIGLALASSVLLVAAVGCSQGRDSEGASRGRGDSTAASSVLSAPTPAASHSKIESPTGAAGRSHMKSPTSPGSPPEIVLRGDGLGVVAFGASKDQVVAVLTAHLGPPRMREEDNPSDWRPGPPELDEAVWWADLQAGFKDGRFVQYFYGGEPRAPRFFTEEGIGLGATLEELRSAYGGRMEEAHDRSLEEGYALKTDSGEVVAAFSDLVGMTGIVS